MKSKRKARAAKEEPAQFATLAERGPARFTVERFFGGVGDAIMVDQAVRVLRSGYQFSTAALDYQLIPAFVILATWALHYEGVELVDDYPALLKAQREAFAEGCVCAHPDLYMASCICLLAERADVPSRETFGTIGVPQLFQQLVTVEESVNE